MKEFGLWLHNGQMVKIKGKTYEELLCNIDEFFDIIKDNTTYYLGYDDEEIIKLANEQEINFETGE